MRIVRIRHLFYPDLPRDHFYELSARQAKMGHDVEVVTWQKKKCCETEIHEGFRIHRLNGLNFGLHGFADNYPLLPELPSTIELLKPDIVHAESHLFLPTLQAIKKAKKLRIPSVVTVHGVFAERGFAVDLLQKMYLRSIGRAILSATDRVICLTRSNVREIERLGCPSSKIALVPNAIDTDLFRPNGDREDNLVVWVGRFVPEKDVESLIEAACETVKKLPDTKFLLIGYGSGKMKLEGLAKRRGLLQRNLILTGPLERERIAAILARATLFVFPSIKEGMPLALLEAMACGLPSIVADFDGVEDIVAHKETGYIVQRKNPAQLSEGIIELLEDKKGRRLLGANARSKILKSNSWEVMTKTLDSIYWDATGFSSRLHIESNNFC